MAVSDAAVAEAVAVASTAHVATVQVGIKAAEETLKLWESVAVFGGHRARTAAQFVNRVMKVLKVRRQHAREIAYAGLRLERALQTGYTLPELGSSSRVQKVRIDDLRRDFERVVNDYAPDALKTVDKKKIEPGPGWDEMIEEWDKGSGGDAKVDPMSDILKLWEADEKRQYQEAKLAYDALVKQYDEQAKAEEEAARRRLRELDAEEEQARQKELHDKAATLAAGVAIKSAQDGGRDVHATVAKRDRRAYGFIRVHNPVNGSKPCAFCALLLSRGPRYYKNTTTAGGAVGSVHQYHPNCRCSGVAVYSKEQYDTDPRFAANRLYEALYHEDFKGISGTHERRIAWRNHIDHMNGVTSKKRKPLSRREYARRMAKRQANSK